MAESSRPAKRAAALASDDPSRDIETPALLTNCTSPHRGDPHGPWGRSSLDGALEKRALQTNGLACDYKWQQPHFPLPSRGDRTSFSANYVTRMPWPFGIID
jgi:hypothetical protein